MISVKVGPAWPQSRPLAEQLEASVFIFDRDPKPGFSSDGVRLATDEELDAVHVGLEFWLLKQGKKEK